jgi:hypothetical protein
MLPKTHIISGLVASLILFLVFPQVTLFYALIILLSSFLIDFDHYLYYAIKFHDWNLSRAYQWFVGRSKLWRAMTQKQRSRYQRAIMIFHGVECWVLLGLLIFVHKIFLFVLIGIAIHMILDFADLFIYNEPFHHKTSIIYTHKRNKNKREFFKA